VITHWLARPLGIPECCGEVRVVLEAFLQWRNVSLVNLNVTVYVDLKYGGLVTRRVRVCNVERLR
jgi:hypothetical protein